jgi:regulator of protease activity HflC (stomatin/prohibitin superfamily)
MAETQTGSSAPEDYAQLTQAQVPLDEAVDAFATRDASGRIPIVVVPQQLNRIRNELVGLALLILIGGIALGILFENAALLIPVAVGLAIILFVVGIYRSFMVRIPEGVNGLLARGGRYIRTLGSGTHVIPPWIVVSHLVTRREIPFDVPVLEVPTQDNVRANVDILITFSITEPYEFVYSISADDFDQVFQAICQDSLRAMVRQITSDEVINLTHHDMEGLRDVLGAAVETYGIKVMKINVTYAQPPAGFMQSQEARKLAALQQAEQAETQALAQRRQTDDEALARQKVVRPRSSRPKPGGVSSNLKPKPKNCAWQNWRSGWPSTLTLQPGKLKDSAWKSVGPWPGTPGLFFRSAAPAILYAPS